MRRGANHQGKNVLFETLGILALVLGMRNQEKVTENLYEKLGQPAKVLLQVGLNAIFKCV